MIISSKAESLPSILRDFKKYTAKEIINTINRINESRKGWILEMFSEVADHLKRTSNFKVWQDGSHPEILLSTKFMEQKLDYPHNNPVSDEIVDEPEEYLYSSARDYYTKKRGYLELEIIE